MCIDKNTCKQSSDSEKFSWKQSIQNAKYSYSDRRSQLWHECDKSATSSQNDLMIGSDIVLLRVNKIEHCTVSMNHIFTKEGGRIQNEIKELASLFGKIYEDIHIAVCKEFRDGFFLCCIKFKR